MVVRHRLRTVHKEAFLPKGFIKITEGIYKKGKSYYLTEELRGHVYRQRGGPEVKQIKTALPIFVMEKR